MAFKNSVIFDEILCSGTFYTNLDDSLVCSIKKTVFSRNAYRKDLMYLKRNTKFQPDRWGLKSSLASQSSLNEIVFRRHKVTQTENVQTYENFSDL
jgi:hypothetical protein